MQCHFSEATCLVVRCIIIFICMFMLAGSWSSVVNVINTSFAGNNASKGAAMLLVGSRGTISARSHYVSNTATTSGAAVAAFSSQLAIANSTFEGNQAWAWQKPSFDLESSSPGEGGACFFGDSNVTIRSCKFLRNTALQGGAVWAGSTKSLDTNVMYKAFQGGAVWAGSMLYMYDTFFEKNAAAQGGALAAVNAAVEMSRVTFTSNDANLAALKQADRVSSGLKNDEPSHGLGGGICYSFAKVKLTGSMFKSNTAVLDGGELISNSNQLGALKSMTPLVLSMLGEPRVCVTYTLCRTGHAFEVVC